jgi:predicted HTH transcriptional regulator
MNVSDLRHLLTLPESATLEFKQEMYDIYHNDHKLREWDKDELIKDLLSLVNGSANSAGETAYLVLGAEDKIDNNGTRAILGITGQIPSSNDILQTVNKACEPPISDLLCEQITVNGKTLLVITLQPSPHLHETTRRLETKNKKAYTERTVFIRQDERIGIASARDRAAIQELKTHRLTEKRNVPPILFGTANGAFLGQLFAQVAAKNKEMRPEEQTALSIVWTIGGGVAGAMLGKAVSDLQDARGVILTVPTKYRPTAIVAFVAGSVGFTVSVSKLLNRYQKEIVAVIIRTVGIFLRVYGLVRRLWS